MDNDLNSGSKTYFTLTAKTLSKHSAISKLRQLDIPKRTYSFRWPLKNISAPEVAKIFFVTFLVSE